MILLQTHKYLRLCFADINTSILLHKQSRRDVHMITFYIYIFFFSKLMFYIFVFLSNCEILSLNYISVS